MNDGAGEVQKSVQIDEDDQDHVLLLQSRSEMETSTTTNEDEEDVRGINNYKSKLKSPAIRLDYSNKERIRNYWKQIGDEEDPQAAASSSSSSSFPFSPSFIARHRHSHGDHESEAGGEALGDPPEWALLLIGCLLGLTTGLCVAGFNRGLTLTVENAVNLLTFATLCIKVHVIHEWAWAGTPNEGAAWLRLQRLADTWHRILLIPVTGGVIVGMMHGLLEILEQIKPSSGTSKSSQRQGLNVLGGVFPTIKAIQAAVTLGTGCSLGPEGPMVDIGTSCANGCYLMMESNKERKIALVAAGAAAGISSGFNAAVAGCFFAIETVLRPLKAENSPPFTTAMIILASVISSTVSNELLGDKSAFTVPSYDLKSAAELPLYLILGMLCGVVSVVFMRLVFWYTKFFEFIKEKFGLPAVVCPALGGLGVGIIALKYPGILYWGFTNVDEILHTGKTASAPGIWLLAQLAAAKVVATALCKGSGLVGGLYAPSLMIGAAVGAVFGGSAAKLINAALPGNAAVAQPQAYALVGMAATLASVCSVPLTSVLLLFELTKDYRILLPLMGAVGLAIWVPSVTNLGNETEQNESRNRRRGYSSVSPRDDADAEDRGTGCEHLELSVMNDDANILRSADGDVLLDGLKVSDAMSYNYLSVRLETTLRDAMKLMREKKQKCALVVDDNNLLEGILTSGDIKRHLSKDSGKVHQDVYACPVYSVCTRGMSCRGLKRGVLTCYPDTDLVTAKDLMEAKDIKQLPVVMRGGDSREERRRKTVAVLHYGSVSNYLREELEYQRSQQQGEAGHHEEMITNGH